MGTYTTNYQLFMPTVGEQGWGELVNNNFSIIDTTMSGLNTRVGTLETKTNTVEERITTLEAGTFETVTANVGNFGDITTSKVISVSSSDMGYSSAGGLYLPYVFGCTYKGSFNITTVNYGSCTAYCILKDGTTTKVTKTASNTNDKTFAITIPNNTVAIYLGFGGANSWNGVAYAPILSF